MPLGWVFFSVLSRPSTDFQVDLISSLNLPWVPISCIGKISLYLSSWSLVNQPHCLHLLTWLYKQPCDSVSLLDYLVFFLCRRGTSLSTHLIELLLSEPVCQPDLIAWIWPWLSAILYSCSGSLLVYLGLCSLALDLCSVLDWIYEEDCLDLRKGLLYVTEDFGFWPVLCFPLSWSGVWTLVCVFTVLCFLLHSAIQWVRPHGRCKLWMLPSCPPERLHHLVYIHLFAICCRLLHSASALLLASEEVTSPVISRVHQSNKPFSNSEFPVLCLFRYLNVFLVEWADECHLPARRF